MKKRDKKIISISAGIAGGIVGTISLGAIVALSVDKTNYRNNKKWLEDQIKNFNGSSLKLRDSRDRINKTISSFNLMDEIKSQLNNILNVYNNQIDKNNKLSIEIQKILDEHKKYRIGHHFGNTSYLRATKNKNAYDLINKTIPEVELKNKEILEQEESDLFIKIVDEVEKKAKELESLRNSNNTIINSISNKVSRFNNLKKAIENYDKSKIDPGVQNNKKLTGSLVEAGLNLMNVDNKLWKDTILSSINIKNTLNDQQINQILNSENLKKVANTTKLDLTEIETIKKSINNYFEQDGKINENAIENRTKTLTELATTKEKINKLRNESLIHYNYAKSRLLAFKDSYTTKQNQLIDFNQFGFTYSLLSSQLIEVDKILTSINKLNISSNKIDLKDILDCLVNIGQLITVDLNNNNIIKNSVVSNADRLISACKISTEITDFKPLLELEESIEHKKIIDTNSNNITSKEIDKWDTNNIDIVKTSFTNIFNYIEQINTNVIELSKLKTEYMKFLDTVKNNMDNLIRISNVNEIVSEKNITSKNTLLLKAKKDYLEVNNKNDFKSKISSSEKVKKENYMNAWIGVFKGYEKYIVNKKAVQSEFDSNYSHLDIQYARESAKQFIDQQQGFIDELVNNLYKKLEADTINWLELPNNDDVEKFVNGQKDLLVSFVKNFYNIIVNQFGYNKMYNFDVPKYNWNNEAKKFEYTTVKILSSADPQYLNKTKAMSDALKQESNANKLKPYGKENLELYKKYGLDKIFFGFQFYGVDYNDRLVDYIEQGYYQDFEDKMWIQSRFNNIFNTYNFGKDEQKTIEEIKSDKLYYTLDIFLKLLLFEKKTTNNILDILIQKSTIVTKTIYDQLMNKLVETISKIVFANIMLIQNSNQYSGNDSKYSTTSNFLLGNWQKAGTTRTIEVMAHEYFKGYKLHPTENGFEVYIDTIKISDAEATDVAKSILNNNLVDLMPIKWKTGHIISTSGLFTSNFFVGWDFHEQKLGKNYHKILREYKPYNKIWASFISNISFKDSFNNEFNYDYIDWLTFHKYDSLKHSYGKKGGYLEGGIEYLNWTSFYNDERIDQFKNYKPVEE